MRQFDCGLGILDISEQIGNADLAEHFRGFTISWARYNYRDELFESTQINEILDRALAAGYLWCLILPYGYVVAQRWTPQQWASDVGDSLLRRLGWESLPAHRTPSLVHEKSLDWIAGGDSSQDDSFLVAGCLSGSDENGYGFKSGLLLVNLEQYRKLKPLSFDQAFDSPVDIPMARIKVQDGELTGLYPTGTVQRRQPTTMGTNFVVASLNNNLPVIGFGNALSGKILDVSGDNLKGCQAIARYFGEHISSFDASQPDTDLSNDQLEFLEMIQPQATCARQGVFLWNIESYEDIEIPGAEFPSPVTSLYSVAAGFKPNRILYTHQWNEDTRVVFFDYSQAALDIKKYMLDHWDGKDFPDFVKHLFEIFPYPMTFYQLWDGLTPDTVKAEDMERIWQRELHRWKGETSFSRNWDAYRKLKHEFVLCNIMQDPTPLFDCVRDEPGAIIWWSNAFFTMYGNWHKTLAERQQIYDQFVEGLAKRNPRIYLVGSDYANVNVNNICAGDYWQRYQQSESSWLNPGKFYKTEISM